MCGLVGIVANHPVNQEIYDALTVLQHRGQDSSGIMTDDNGVLCLRKSNGLVSDVFSQEDMATLRGNIGIGHVRYPTAGSLSSTEAQPFYVNTPFGISLAHNGNLVNTNELRDHLKKVDKIKFPVMKVLKNINDKESLNFNNDSLKLIQNLFNSDIRSMINYMQSNENLINDKKIIKNELWDTVISSIKENDLKYNIEQINDLSSEYNIEKRNILKNMLRSLIITMMEQSYLERNTGMFIALFLNEVWVPAL